MSLSFFAWSAYSLHEMTTGWNTSFCYRRHWRSAQTWWTK